MGLQVCRRQGVDRPIESGAAKVTDQTTSAMKNAEMEDNKQGAQMILLRTAALTSISAVEAIRGHACGCRMAALDIR